MNGLSFSFSDLISGYVTSYDETNKVVGIETSDGRNYECKITGNTYARQTQNLGEGWISADLGKLLQKGQMIFAYGTYYPENKVKFEINYMVFAG